MEIKKTKQKKVSEFILKNFKEFDSVDFADRSFWVDFEVMKDGKIPYMNPKYNLIILN